MQMILSREVDADWKGFLSQGRALCANHPVLWRGLEKTPLGKTHVTHLSTALFH